MARGAASWRAAVPVSTMETPIHLGRHCQWTATNGLFEKKEFSLIKIIIIIITCT
jgi:hypothetical protein